MLGRMLTMMRKDALTGGRDQIILYMLLSPIVLGLLLALILPVVEDAGPRFVVSEGLAALEREALAAHGEVEIVPDRAAVERRVLGRDDAIGVVPAGPGSRPGEVESEVEIIVEGDEPEALWALPRAILAGTLPREAADHADGELRRIAAALTGYCVVVIVGLMLGFAILEEKITNVHVAYDVSPLRFGEYLGAKLILAVGLALVMVIPAVALPLGFDLDWPAILLTVLASVPFAVTLGLCVGVVARDQLGAVAVVKALLPVWTSLPILGFVVPDAWMWTQWPFANHWGAQGLYHALGDQVGVWTHAGLGLATGLPVFLAAALVLRRKLGLAKAP